MLDFDVIYPAHTIGDGVGIFASITGDGPAAYRERGLMPE